MQLVEGTYERQRIIAMIYKLTCYWPEGNVTETHYFETRKDAKEYAKKMGFTVYTIKPECE